MAFCSKCGNYIDDQANYCPTCGNAVVPNTDDEGGLGWNLVGFCCPPLVAFIMYLIWQNSKPNRAEAICHGALFYILISILIGALYFVLGVMG